MAQSDAPLRAECDFCGAPNALLRRRTTQIVEHLCPHCARQDALDTAAFEQLSVLVEQAVRAWRQDWPDQTRLGSLSEMLDQIGPSVEEKLNQEARR